LPISSCKIRLNLIICFFLLHPWVSAFCVLCNIRATTRPSK
jgi:hypothetical protein